MCLSCNGTCRWTLPVYKVQLVGETTRSRVLHRNLLFPLAMRNESDEKTTKYGGKGT